MELKQYQSQALQDLKTYLSYLNQYHNNAKAYTLLWENKGVKVGSKEKMKPYKNVLPRVPHVCFKVPTGGGKTFLACASVKPIFDALTMSNVKAVVWLVPSDAILSQTVRNLKNTDHPYRQRLDRDFGGKVTVYTKEEALNGQGFNPSAVRDQLSVFVFSYDSFRTGKKEGRKAYQQNGQLSSFKNDTVYPGYRIEYAPHEEWPSLAAVIRSLEPVVVVDESHHAQTDLSIDMLRGFNPVFTLDLTATPRSNSNIISVVEAWKLKAEHMVKLPVIVSNQRGQGAVLDAAIKMQKLLEEQAVADEKETGVYIRPIVLLQAESRNKNDSTTYEKIKQKLVDGGIPAAQIAIKTADVNELKVKGRDVDLLSRACPIRYIITVNALKEGWDCPFAYVLATIANRSSVVDVEQIVGRILRLPHAREAKRKFLNMSYVFTNSGDFQSTLDKVVKGLNNAGFSKKEYRVAIGEEEAVTDTDASTQVMANLFGVSAGETEAQENSADGLSGRSAGNADGNAMQPGGTLPGSGNGSADTEAISEFMDMDTTGRPFAQASQSYEEVGNNIPEGMKAFFDAASQQQNEYDEQAKAAAQQNFDAPTEYVDESDVVYVREEFREQIRDTVRLPKFYYKIPASSLFSSDTEGKEPVTKEFLSKDFKLSQQNTEIDFESMNAEIYSFDVEMGDETPKRCKMSKRDADAFKAALKLVPPESRKKQMKAKLVEQINEKYNTLSQQEIKIYIDHIIDGMNADRLADMEENFLAYSEKVANKIKTLLDGWYEKRFTDLLTAQEIFVDFTFAFSEKAIVPGNKSEWKKMLYTGEGKMNPFEQSLIEEICGMDNILWWHRNGEKPYDKNAWCINGGFLNHYPDFIIMTKKGHLVAVETKGEQLGNAESFAKARLGHLLDTHDNNDKFSYFMVFEKEKPDRPGCKGWQEFLNLLEKW